MPETLELAEEAEALLEAEVRPFQLFARLLDGKTAVLDDISLSTPIAALRERIAARMPGPPPAAELRLVCGGKELQDGKRVGEYGIQREWTVHVLLRLRGGYGEVAAVGHSLDQGIRRGNNGDTIRETRGASMVHKDWGRGLDGDPDLFDKVFEILDEQGIFAGDDWLERSWVHVSALIQEVSGGGNCGDFAQVVHSHLVANTTDQYVYQLVMSGDWDHQLCVTYPTKVTKIAQMDPDVATIADGWDNYMVIPLRDFLNKTNCYGAQIKNLDACPECGEDSGYGCEDKCENFLCMVASQKCTGDGGLRGPVRDAIAEYVQGEFDAYKDSPAYKADLKEARKEKRGIFNFDVVDDVQDKRTDDDILTKIEALLKANEHRLLRLELLDLSAAQLRAVFCGGRAYRNLVLEVDDARDQLYADLLSAGDGDFLLVTNAMTQPQFRAFCEAGPEHRARALETPYAAQRLYAQLRRASKKAQAAFAMSLTGAQLLSFCGVALDGVLGSDGPRDKLFAVLADAPTADLERVGETLPDHALLDFFRFSDGSRAAIRGSAALRAVLYAAMDADADAFGPAAALMGPEDIRDYADSSDARRARVMADALLKAAYES